MSATWSSLSGARVGTPELKGGRCVGEWEIFDNEHGSAELEEYAIICARHVPHSLNADPGLSRSSRASGQSEWSPEGLSANRRRWQREAPPYPALQALQRRSHRRTGPCLSSLPDNTAGTG